MQNSCWNETLKKIILAHKAEYISIFAFTAIINLLLLAPSWYMLEVYDRVLTSRDINTLIGLSIIVLFLYFLFGLLERYRGLILIEISEAIDREITPKIYESILDVTKKNNQKNRATLNDLNNVKAFLTGQPILSFLDAPWFFIYILMIYLLSPGMGIIALLSVIILFSLAYLNQRLTTSKLESAQVSANDERIIVTNSISSLDSIFIMGMRLPIKNQLRITRVNYLASLLIASSRAVNFSALTKFSRTVIQSLILGYGAYLAVDNQITGGMIIAGSILLGRTLSPIEGIINSWKQLNDFRKSYKLLSDLFVNSKHKAYTIVLGPPSGEIQLKDVELRLRSKGELTLHKVNLKIYAGESVAIIGASGAGKTSLLKVIAGIYQPTHGQVLLDGSNLAYRDMDELGKYFGYLGQNTDLLNGKISLNIARFGEVNSEKILDAAKVCGAHEMIIGLPEGYETMLGDFGYGLSEGQKRKLGIARALYGDPNVVFLDEPGNGLDETSLGKVVSMINNLKDKNKTLIYTTHNSKLVELADKVILLVDGKVSMYGPRKEVLLRLAGR